MPACPYCKQELKKLFFSLKRDLLWSKRRWVIDPSDEQVNIVCSSCYEELEPKDLETLGIDYKFRKAI